MNHSPATVSVALIRISLHIDEIADEICPGCSHPMDLHQPDSGFPDRMLWTCQQCATWYLMDIDPVKPEAVLVCLPDRGYFQATLEGLAANDTA